MIPNSADNAPVRRLLILSLIFLLACHGRPESNRLPRNVVVIGIDGATWYVIRQLARDGQLPNIGRLFANGAWADLQTIAPTKSPAIWTSLATGYTPAQHGVGDFVVQVPGTGATTLVGTTQRRTAAIWNLATAAGVTVGVVNWWATFPAEKVKGFVVSDRANLRRRFGYQSVLHLSDTNLESVGQGETYPPELLTKIVDVIGTNSELPREATELLVGPMPPEWQQRIAANQKLVRSDRLSVLKFVALQDHAAATAARVALDAEGVPRLLLVYFSGLDAAEHQFWAYYEPHRYPVPPPPDEVKALGHVVPNYYRYVDTLIGDLLKRVPKDSLVVLMSDHGQDANVDWDPKAQIGDYGKWTMGNHGNAPPGILLFAGPGVQPGYLRRTTVYDVAPTLLATIGIAPSRDMPGRVITEAFTQAARDTLPKDRVDRAPMVPPVNRPTPAQVDPEVLEKLRSLGYIR